MENFYLWSNSKFSYVKSTLGLLFIAVFNISFAWALPEDNTDPFFDRGGVKETPVSVKVDKRIAHIEEGDFTNSNYIPSSDVISFDAEAFTRYQEIPENHNF